MEGSTVAPVNPWVLLTASPDVALVWHDGDDMGYADHDTGTISLRRGMTRAQRRCTVLHEWLHLRRGPTISTLVDRDEWSVRRETARLLLPNVRTLGNALAWAMTPAEAADELDVDLGVLRDRIRFLHPAERHYLTRRLADDPEPVAGLA